MEQDQNPAKPAGGRPPTYQDSFAEQARKLCVLGATDMELADFFEVDVRTIYRWAQTKGQFCQALKSGKDSADERVVRSLYAKATGYTFDAVKVFQYEGAPVIVNYREHVPPSDTAMIFWLKNRRKAEWRDRHEVTGADGGPITTVALVTADPVEAAKEYQRLLSGEG